MTDTESYVVEAPPVWATDDPALCRRRRRTGAARGGDAVGRMLGLVAAPFEQLEQALGQRLVILGNQDALRHRPLSW